MSLTRVSNCAVQDKESELARSLLLFTPHLPATRDGQVVRSEREGSAVGRFEGLNPEGKGRALSFRESDSAANVPVELRQREEERFQHHMIAVYQCNPFAAGLISQSYNHLKNGAIFVERVSMP